MRAFGQLGFFSFVRQFMFDKAISEALSLCDRRLHPHRTLTTQGAMSGVGLNTMKVGGFGSGPC
jgi:hypothetical protein